MLKKHQKSLFYTYLSLILLLITLPLNSAGELNNIHIIKIRGDYFFHVLLFAPWMFFAGIFSIRSFLWLIIGILFAAGMEGLQYLLPYRAFNVNDLVANVLGVVVGFVIWLIYRKLIGGRDLSTNLRKLN